MSRSLVDRMRSGEPLPAALDLALRPAESAIQWGMRRRLCQPAERVTAHVISYGNITTGGTGKTPAVIERAGQEVAEGRRVAVLTRGYGAPCDEPAASPEVEPQHHYHALGDEAALILQRFPEVRVFKNPDRVAAAHRAIEEFGCNVLILDDAYQYTRLERDENVLVLDATCPFGNGRLLPRGILREPLEAMQRASAVVVTRCDQAPRLAVLQEALKVHIPSAPVRYTVHAPTGVVHVASGRVEPLKWLRGRAAVAACGIGHPPAFFETLKRLGVTITSEVAWRDHAEWTPDVLLADECIVTTEKDAVRLRSVPENLYALRIDLKDWRAPKKS